MEDELHEVVRLLLARMETHPDEFRSWDGRKRETGRWAAALDEIFEYGSDAEEKALRAALRVVRLAEIHDEVLDELYNGEERRDAERRERTKEAQLQQQALMQAQLQKYSQYSQTATLLGTGGTVGLTDTLRNKIRGKLFT